MALRHAQHGEVVNLSALNAGGEQAHSTALVKTEAFEAIHLLVHAGVSIHPHHVTGQSTLQCLSGSVRLLFDAITVTLKPGDWIYLERAEEHGIEGIEDAALLLTILFEHPVASSSS